MGNVVNSDCEITLAYENHFGLNKDHSFQLSSTQQIRAQRVGLHIQKTVEEFYVLHEFFPALKVTKRLRLQENRQSLKLVRLSVNEYTVLNVPLRQFL